MIKINKFKEIILAIRAIPKTVYFNFKYLKVKDAIKFPMIISHRVYLSKMKGKIIIDSNIKFGMIKVGFGKVRIFDQSKMTCVWHLEGTIIFKGRASIGNGTKLSILGTLELGNNFIISAHSQVECRKYISFGENVLIGWDCLFMDTDGHKILNYDNHLMNENKEIIIGNKVWFGARSTVLKGVQISNNNVIAANSCVTHKFSENNCIIGGYPAKIIKRNIKWEG